MSEPKPPTMANESDDDSDAVPETSAGLVSLAKRLRAAAAKWKRDRDRWQKTHVSLTDERKLEYLAALEVLGEHQAAADVVGINARTARTHRTEDPEFAADCEVAVERFRNGLTAEARRRAVEGWDEPVYQGGAKVGVKRMYSDRLLEQMLKAKVPEFRDKLGVEHSGGMSNVSIALPPAMTPEEYTAFVAGALRPKTDSDDAG